MGTNACLACKCCPSHKPSGIPSNVEIVKPTATRQSEAMISLKSRPLMISSLKLVRTAFGEGNAYPGKSCKYAIRYQIANKTATTPRGSMKLKYLFLFIFLLSFAVPGVCIYVYNRLLPDCKIIQKSWEFILNQSRLNAS